jgi:hypothetical protein
MAMARAQELQEWDRENGKIMAMARAQELQEWDWENGKWSWWCHTHFCNGRFAHQVTNVLPT